MNKRQGIRCIDGLTLKILAMAFMLCDHMWATVLSNQHFLTDIGRLAMPIFAFQIVEAFHYTSNYRKLMQRIFIFALISEIPFNLMTGGELLNPFHQNVMFTFLIALFFLNMMEKAKQRWGVSLRYNITVALGCLAGMLLGTLCMVDYFGFGVITVFLFYLSRNLRYGWVAQLIGMYVINCVMLAGQVIPVTLAGHLFEIPQQGFALLALIPIWLYNGKRGYHNKAVQMAYYAFYPMHILVLALLVLYGV